MARTILGISAYYHDSAAALLIGDEIVAAAHEERFSRKKHDSSFPARAVRYVLKERGLSLGDLDAVAFYDKPVLKFERLLATYQGFAPRGLRSFMTSMPIWFRDKLFLGRILRQELADIGPGAPDILYPEHHLSHMASAFYPSPFAEAAILTIDGVGEWATSSIGLGRGREISILRQLDFPHSLGLLYSAFTAFCGFKVNSGEYKLMGLAPYGDPESEQVREWKEIILTEMVDLREDGSLLLNMDHFNYATGLTMCRKGRFEKLFGISSRPRESELTRDYMNLALAIQQVTEEAVLRMARTARNLTGCTKLVMAGGVALNCVANGKLVREKTFDRVWIQPAAGDAGGALGAALAARHIHFDAERPPRKDGDDMQGSYLGPAFGNEAIRRTACKYDARNTQMADDEQLFDKVAGLLAQGKVVGWFQGRMEWGPRALGNRSILGDPRDPDMQKKLNLKIKYREGFRPFAPSVLAEDADGYFGLEGESSPYMLLVAPVNEDRCRPLPENKDGMDLFARLYAERSDIQAVTHVDYSARIQTVHKDTNPRYHGLISAFKEKTGCSLVVNTSFNVRGEPIVCTPEDAYRCFMRTEMDVLVLNDRIFLKEEQPAWKEESDWQDEFELD